MTGRVERLGISSTGPLCLFSSLTAIDPGQRS